LSAICGTWLLHGEDHPRSVCERMLQSLAAHGPDGSNLIASDRMPGASVRVALGHRLLKITAEDELEAQPVTAPVAANSLSIQETEPTCDARIWLVADARIDNRSQLAAVNNGRPGTMASRNIESYHQTAVQHAQAQPISAADRQAGAHYNPNARMANQDQRIANGERSGQMTSGEATRADRTQSKIDQQVHNDRMANGGKLTGQERQQINQEQNAASRQIYNEKHNANTVTPNEVNNREANQQQRTAQGLRSGQMTAGEAARTNRNQAALDQKVHNERAANGDALTQQQRRQANQQENKNSRQIYNEKHNGNTANSEPKGHER